MINWTTLFVSIIPTFLTCWFTYIRATKQFKKDIEALKIESQNKLDAMEKQNNAEMEKMKLEYELKLKEVSKTQEVDWTNKFMSGQVNMGELTKNIGQLGNLLDVVNNLNKK